MAVDKKIVMEIMDRAIMRPYKGYSERKAELIATILDRIKPIPEDAPDDIKQNIDVERQLLVIRTGWNKMSIEELENLKNNPAVDPTMLA
jgi:hypothetical protein